MGDLLMSEIHPQMVLNVSIFFFFLASPGELGGWCLQDLSSPIKDGTWAFISGSVGS